MMVPSAPSDTTLPNHKRMDLLKKLFRWIYYFLITNFVTLPTYSMEQCALQDFIKRTLASVVLVVRCLLSLRRVVAAKIIELVGFPGIAVYVIGLKISKKFWIWLRHSCICINSKIAEDEIICDKNTEVSRTVRFSLHTIWWSHKLPKNQLLCPKNWKNQNHFAPRLWIICKKKKCRSFLNISKLLF